VAIACTCSSMVRACAGLPEPADHPVQRGRRHFQPQHAGSAPAPGDWMRFGDKITTLVLAIRANAYHLPIQTTRVLIAQSKAMSWSAHHCPYPGAPNKTHKQLGCKLAMYKILIAERSPAISRRADLQCHSAPACCAMLIELRPWTAPA